MPAEQEPKGASRSSEIQSNSERFIARMRTISYCALVIGVAVGVGLGVGSGYIIKRGEDRQLLRKQEYLADAMASGVQLSMRSVEADGATLAAQYIFENRFHLENPDIFVGYGEKLLRTSQKELYYSLSYYPAVEHIERHLYEAEMRTVHPGYEIREVLDGQLARRRNQTVYYPTHFFYPPDLGIHGYDAGSSPVRLEAMELAIKTGMAAASARIRLDKDNFGVIWFTPILINSTVEGFTSSIIKFNEMFFSTIENATQNDVVVHVFDIGTEEQPSDTLIFSSLNPGQASYNQVTLQKVTASSLWKDVYVGQRHWRLAIGVHPNLEESVETEAPITVGVAVGLSVTATWILICISYLSLVKERTELSKEVDMAKIILDSISRLQIREAKEILSNCSINPYLKEQFENITSYIAHFNAFLPDFKPLEGREQSSESQPDEAINPLTTASLRLNQSVASVASSEEEEQPSLASSARLVSRPTVMGLKIDRLTVVDISYEILMTDGRSSAVVIDTFLKSMTEVCQQVDARITYAASTRATAILKGSRPAESLFIANHLVRGFSYERVTCAIATGLASHGVAGGTAFRFYTYAGTLPQLVQNMLNFGYANRFQIVCNKAISNPSLPYLDTIYPDEEVYAVYADRDITSIGKLIREGDLKKAESYLDKLQRNRDMNPYMAYYQKRYFSGQKKPEKKVIIQAVVVNETQGSMTNPIIRPVWRDLPEKQKKQVVYRKKRVVNSTPVAIVANPPQPSPQPPRLPDLEREDSAGSVSTIPKKVSTSSGEIPGTLEAEAQPTLS